MAQLHEGPSRYTPEQAETPSAGRLRSMVVIPDGSRRWASAHGLTPEEGQEAGANKMLVITEFLLEQTEIEAIYGWAFSTDNWDRPQEQIDGTMRVIERIIEKAEPLLHKYQVKFKVLGNEERIKERYPSLWEKAKSLEERTKQYEKRRFGLLLDYSGKDQHLRVMQKLKIMVLENPDLEITEELYNSLLDGYDEGCSRPVDVVVRTSGEQRTSGLGPLGDMAEFISISDLLPDTDEADGDFILEEFKRRQRRYGK